MTKSFTKQGLEKLRKELEELKKEKKQVVRDVAKAASFGDLSENAAYSQAKEKNRELEDKIFELEKMLSNVKIIENENCQTVQLGSTIILKNNQGKETFTIVNPIEADITKNLISSESPIGKAVLGKAKGEKVEIQTPAGATTYTITDIQ